MPYQFAVDAGTRSWNKKHSKKLTPE